MKTVLDKLPLKKRKLLTGIMVKYFEQDPEYRRKDAALKKFWEEAISQFVEDEIAEDAANAQVKTP